MIKFTSKIVIILSVTIFGSIIQYCLLIKYTFASEVKNHQNAEQIELLSTSTRELQLYNSDNIDVQTKVVDLELTDKNSQPYSSKNLRDPSLESHLHLYSRLSDLYSDIPNKLTFWEIEKNQNLKAEESPKYIPLVIEIEEKREEKSQENSNIEADPDYIIPPRVAPKKRINPFTTTLPLNGIPISHLTEWEFIGGSVFGDQINTSVNANGTFKLTSEVKESLTRDNIFTVDQRGSYLQLQTVRENREVLVAKKEPQTLLGMEMQMSLTASCLFPETTSEQQCTYTPGLEVDRDSIDSDFLVPTRITQTANVGDVMTPESLAVMTLPGFQMGANGQKVGINNYFPNVGALPGNSKGTDYFYVREEDIENTPVGFYSRVRQIVRANDQEAVIGRTVRGIGFIVDDDNFLLNSALQLGNFLLPDVNPRLAPGKSKANASINRNLFLAANNTRLPVNSFTFYHAGVGHAKSIQSPVNNLNQVPSANFNSVWVGLSPVTKRRIERVVRYETFGSKRITSEAGAEGGVDSNVSLTSVVNSATYSTDELEDFYAQVYLSNFAQDAYFVTGNKLIEETNYYPHISLTGNITGSQHVLRYYGGVITGETIKPYLGGDITKTTLDGWSFTGGAVGYINPDRDYYSQLLGNISKTVSFNRSNNLVFSTAFNYALDREERISNIESKSSASYLTLGARANIGDVSFGLINYFGDILPDSIEETLLLDLKIKFNDYFTMSGYYSPINENSSNSRYGARAQIRFSRSYNSPTLSFSWTNNEYDLGRDPVDGTQIDLNDNVFTVLFRFGAPPNPFDQATAERLRQRVNNGVQDLQRERELEELQQQKPNPVAD
jgi:hypothetical protein